MVRDFMIEMNQEIVQNKTKSVWNYIKYLLYFNNFYLYNNIPFLITNVIILYFIDGNPINKFLSFLAASFSYWFLHWFSHKCRVFNFCGHRLHHKEKQPSLKIYTSFQAMFLLLDLVSYC